MVGCNASYTCNSKGHWAFLPSQSPMYMPVHYTPFRLPRLQHIFHPPYWSSSACIATPKNPPTMLCLSLRKCVFHPYSMHEPVPNSPQHLPSFIRVFLQSLPHVKQTIVRPSAAQLSSVIAPMQVTPSATQTFIPVAPLWKHPAVHIIV